MFRLRVALGGAAVALCVAHGAQAANIITFNDATQKCGGAVICSFDGTAGYYTDGTGRPFNLSTIGQWFQIDTGSVSHLSGQSAEPDKGAGGFLVVNDTGAPITRFSFTLYDAFTSTTASVHPCKGAQAGNICDNFTAHGGNGTTFNTGLSGADWDHCTQGQTIGQTCTGNSGGVAADFSPGSVTYSWAAQPGKSIAAGATFRISFSGWNTDTYTNGSMCDYVPGNLVQNCGFETGDLTDWSSRGGRGDTVGISSESDSGSYSVVMDSSGAGGFADMNILEQGHVPFAAGVTYVVSVYVKAVNWDGQGDQGLELNVNEGGYVCHGSDYYVHGGGNYSTWTKLSCTFVGDGGATADAIDIETVNNSFTDEKWLLDDFTVTSQ